MDSQISNIPTGHSYIDGLTLLVLGVLMIIIFVLIVKIKDFRTSYWLYRNYFHRYDDITVKPTDVLPYDLKKNSYRLGNTVIYIERLKPKNQEIMDDLGIIKIDELSKKYH